MAFLAATAERFHSLQSCPISRKLQNINGEDGKVGPDKFYATGGNSFNIQVTQSSKISLWNQIIFH